MKSTRILRTSSSRYGNEIIIMVKGEDLGIIVKKSSGEIAEPFITQERILSQDLLKKCRPAGS
ncbi:hypothetical protein DRP53_02310 [candidate division WOR-3 bacterium]|uniref:Uncharacterized protein n=1 Tax=candidate division WOR-3 bacterium TaxID=2052148 RepID=A0A660SKB4_UNCW3|nr:MAG: hypothetical protein DRP53_02310 [candidate division WOR-3 bacterium]